MMSAPPWVWFLGVVGILLFGWPVVVSVTVMFRWWVCPTKSAWNSDGAVTAVARGLTLYQCPRCHRWHEGLVQS